MQLFVFDEQGYKTHVIENTLYINNQCFEYINDILYYVQEDKPYQRIVFDQYFVIDEIKYFATKGAYTTYKAPSKLLFGSYGDIIINNGFIEKLNINIKDKDKTIENIKDELSNIYLSKSWKITKPLRYLMKKLDKGN